MCLSYSFLTGCKSCLQFELIQCVKVIWDSIKISGQQKVQRITQVFRIPVLNVIKFLSENNFVCFNQS